MIAWAAFMMALVALLLQAAWFLLVFLFARKMRPYAAMLGMGKPTISSSQAPNSPADIR